MKTFTLDFAPEPVVMYEEIGRKKIENRPERSAPISYFLIPISFFAALTFASSIMLWLMVTVERLSHL